MADIKPWEAFASGSPSTAAPDQAKPWEAFGGKTEPKGSGALGKLADVGLGLAQSAIAVPETAVGLADLVTGGKAGKFLANEGGDLGFRPGQAKQVLEDWKSDGLKAKKQEFQQADGIIGKAGVAIKNPSLVVDSVAQSVAPMFAGGIIGRGVLAVAPRVGAAGAGAIGEGVVGAGSAAEQIRQESADGELSAKQSGLAAASGAGTALFGALGGKVASKLGIGDVDTMITQGAAKSAGAASTRSIPRQAIEGAISEGLLEELPQSVSEQIIQNLALDKPWSEGVDAAAVMGTLAGMGMGGAASGLSGFAERGRRPVDPGTENPAGELTTSPSAADPAAQVAGQIQGPEAPDFSTSLGARDQADGLDFARDIDTSGLGLVDPQEEERARRASIDFNGDNDTTPAWSTEPGAAASRMASLDFGREFDTGNLSLADQPAKPSALMGLNPSAGPISAAATLAVDSGAYTDVTPLTQRPGIGAQRRLAESPIIDVDARVIEDSAQAISTPRRIQGQNDVSNAVPAGRAVSRPDGAVGGDVPGGIGARLPYQQPGRIGRGVADGGAAAQPGAGGQQDVAGSSGGRVAGDSALSPKRTLRDVIAQRQAAAQAQQTGVPNEPATPQSIEGQPILQEAADQGGPGQAAAGTQAGGVSNARSASVEATGVKLGGDRQSVIKQLGDALRTGGWQEFVKRRAEISDRYNLDVRQTLDLGTLTAGEVGPLYDLEHAKAFPFKAGRIAYTNSQAPIAPDGLSPEQASEWMAGWDDGASREPEARAARPSGEVVGEARVVGEQPQLEAPSQQPAPAQTIAARKKARQHPPTVRGSGALAEVSRALGGISPDLLADLSEKVNRTRTSKTGKATKYTSWDNPAIPGVGPLFRKGGTGDIAEVARVLEEAGYLEAGANENDPIGAMQRAQEIIKREMRKGGSTTQVGNADAIDAEMRARLEAEMDAAADPWDDFSFAPDDLDEVGFTDASETARALTEQLIAEAEALGIDTETIREDVARMVGEEASQDEYHAATQEALRTAVAQVGRSAGQSDASRARASNQDGGGTAEQAGREGGQGQRQGGPDREALTLEAQTEEDLRAKSEREDAATSQAAAEKAAEQERLRREAEARDNKARADATVDDFQLGQSADQQMSGMDDLFGGAQDAATQSSPADFISTPDGGLDYGEITTEMGKAMRRQPGKIRLQRGDASFGLEHIENRHGDEIRAAGFGSIQEFVAGAVSDIESVWRPSATSQLVVIQATERGKVVFIQLQVGRDEAGDFYTVNTAFPASRTYAEKRKAWEKLWSRVPVPAVDAGTSTSSAVPADEAGGQATMDSSQSSAQSLPQTNEGAQADTPKLAQAEAKELMSWQDLGQKGGVRTHELTFYESQADKDAKRGRMSLVRLTKGDRSSTHWQIDGNDRKFAMLGVAKKAAEEVGMARAVSDGFVQAPTQAAATKPQAAPAPAPEVSAPTKPAPTESPNAAGLEAIFEGLQGRGLKKKNATEAAKAHPLAERITLVDKHILDILGDLDDSGTIKINC